MITKNFKSLLATVLESANVNYGMMPVLNVEGVPYFTNPQFSFPGSRTTTPTLTATAAGISVGTGDTPATENDVQLESHLSSGINLTLTATNVGAGSPCDAYVEYYVTVTNTGSSPVTIKEICYKQTLKAADRPTKSATADVVCMLDRTVLDEPMTVQAGDAGVIFYRLTTRLKEPTTVSGVKIVDFTWGSDEDVAAMIDAARLGTIDLQTDGGWRVGDMRVINVAAFTGGNNVAHAAQKATIVISQFGDYNNCGCLFQFDFVDCLAETQRMNSTATTVGGYGSTEMYTDTLPAYANALPEWLKTRLKTFDVLASKGGSELTTIETVGNNKLALRAAVEVFGAGGNGQPGEGTQVEYYNVTAERIKPGGFTGSAANWWERSANSSTNFCYVGNFGTAGSHSASNSNGVAPFGCI